MNERIRELQIQAEAAADEIFDRKGKMYGEIVMEKFAELIVGECSGIVQNYMSRWPEDCDLVIKIKEHFGVEE
jgi:hypothetical protein